MNIQQKQSQFELFPGSPGSSFDAEKPRYLFTHWTFTMDNIVMISIVFMMALIVSFCLGVEKGKTAGFPDGVGAGTQLAVAEPMAEEVASVAMAAPVTHTELPADNKVIEEVVLAAPEQAVETDSLTGKYTIQVASFKLEKYAKEEADTLKEKGYDIYVLPKGQYSIVCVGKFTNKDEAEFFSRRLKNRYKDFLIRRL